VYWIGCLSQFILRHLIGALLPVYPIVVTRTLCNYHRSVPFATLAAILVNKCGGYENQSWGALTNRGYCLPHPELPRIHYHRRHKSTNKNHNKERNVCERKIWLVVLARTITTLRWILMTLQLAVLLASLALLRLRYTTADQLRLVEGGQRPHRFLGCHRPLPHHPTLFQTI
jgi:hypothetical protein